MRKFIISLVEPLILLCCYGSHLPDSFHSIVPYIDPPITGALAGIIGSGGNVGGVAFGFCFRQMDSKSAFRVMGSIILVSAFLSVFVVIPGQNGLVCNNGVGPVTRNTKVIECAESDDEGRADTESAGTPPESVNNGSEGPDANSTDHL